MSGTALAPAAVEDERCALRWVYRKAEHFHLDTGRIAEAGALSSTKVMQSGSPANELLPGVANLRVHF